MEVSLQGALRRAAVLAVALAAAAVLISQAGTLWLARHRMDSGRADLVERAAALTPGNAEAWDQLGRLRQWDLGNAEPAQAIAAYEKAVRANPRSAHYWMDLASGYEAAGDNVRAQDAFGRALAVYPASAEVAFYYGNFLLRRQEYPAAYQELHRAVHADPKLLPLAISRAWRASGDVQALLDRMLPADADAYLQAVDFFASIGQAEPALAVWQRLVKLGQPVVLSRTFPFMDELIGADRAGDARRVWREALGAAGLPNQEPGNGSLVWNGDFQKDFAEGGLDWRWNMPLGVSIDFDTAPAPDHSRAVRLDFGGGTNPQLSAPFQYVPVEPGRTYHLRAYLRTSEITTESGVHFELIDPNHAGAVNVVTEDFTGTHAWTAVDAEVTTGPNTQFLLVRLARLPSRLFENKLSGTAWMADVSLVPASPAAERAPQ